MAQPLTELLPYKLELLKSIRCLRLAAVELKDPTLESIYLRIELRLLHEIKAELKARKK